MTTERFEYGNGHNASHLGDRIKVLLTQLRLNEHIFVMSE